jgi:hypothetical protein
MVLSAYEEERRVRIESNQVSGSRAQMRIFFAQQNGG